MKKISLALVAMICAVVSMSAQVRQTTLLQGDWQFKKGRYEQGLGAQGIKVSVPHSWNAEDGCTDGYYRGEGTYECRFDAPKHIGGKRVFVRFEGVSLTAEVFCNGVRLGSHQGAFNAFCFEITDLLKPHDNRLVVVADNAKNADVIPLAGDFTVFGGIYRPVWLMVLPEVCLSPLDYASPGVYVSQNNVTESKAQLEVKAVVSMGKQPLQKCSLKTTVLNAEGQLVAVSQGGAMVTDSEGRVLIKHKLEIDNPTLWQGKENPYQYTFRFELLKGKQVVDVLHQSIGLRSFRVDNRKGFFLNGKPYNLRGVNRHQDRQGKGWAITEAEHNEDFAMINEIGANGVRLAHYPQSGYFYSLCDAGGMLVWAEIPFIERGTDSSMQFAHNTKEQLIEMIRQNYNHTSIFCWGLFNELGVGHPETLVWQLNELAHQEDPTRFTVAATNQDNKVYNFYTDILAYNTYPGWYWADPQTMRYAVDWKYEPTNKQPGIGVSEYGAGASIKHHEENVKKPKTDGDWHPEEWQAVCHEGNNEEIVKREWLWGTFVWNMFDFASASRREGDTYGINDKGLVTYDRKVRKDAFYYYKAQWNKEPMVHICSKRFVERTQNSTTVKVYSNCSGVQLEVNGKALGTVSPKLNVYEWKGVALQKGENTIKVTANGGGEIITDTCVWTLK